MLSDNKIAANRRNAQKRTGPKTTAGKEKSRRNALKHGLAGDGTVMRPEELALFQERLHDWTGEKEADGPRETYVLGCAVVASVRMDRCAHLDFADVAQRRGRAIDNWERRQKRRIKAARKLIEDDPGRAV